MVYISFLFYVFVIAMAILYYCIPQKHRWMVLLLANITFIFAFYKTGWWLILFTVCMSYVWGLILGKMKGRFSKVVLFMSIVAVLLPWAWVKTYELINDLGRGFSALSVIVPIGISFYTLQMIAYLVDVYNGKINAQKNVFKFLLYGTYFPILVQGPIPRYKVLQFELIEGHRFDEEKITQGVYMIIWGFFLKMMIADKAGVVVNTVFNGYKAYTGVYMWIASILYSIQLYADFCGCTSIVRGISSLFGIELPENFRRPYLATSFKDFWARWHISLSTWLRDYIYFPLGGSRNGTLRKYTNLIITFIVSGIWHGAGLTFIIWGLLHALYRVFESVISVDKWNIVVKRLLVLLGVNFAWVIFRAENMGSALYMLRSMFTDINIWTLFNNRIFTLGLSWKQYLVLVISVIILFVIESKQEKGISIRNLVMKCSTWIRWTIVVCVIISIFVFGTYGFGYNAQEFIYGGF